MTDDRFEALVAESIDALPAWVREELENVAFLIEAYPTEKQRLAHGVTTTETLFGLYEGVPLTERGSDAPLYPDTITIFREPILATYESEEDIRAAIDNTVWHEVAHYFGYDEPWVEAEEIKRGKIL